MAKVWAVLLCIGLTGLTLLAAPMLVSSLMQWATEHQTTARILAIAAPSLSLTVLAAITRHLDHQRP